MVDIKIHDIKPLLEINDHSFYIFVALICLASIFVLGSAYLVFRFFKHRNLYNKKTDYLQKLGALDINDTKKTAYGITHYGEIFKDDSTRHKEMFLNLSQRLQQYKYKKEVESFDDETLGYIELYKGMCDV